MWTQGEVEGTHARALLTEAAWLVVQQNHLQCGVLLAHVVARVVRTLVRHVGAAAHDLTAQRRCGARRPGGGWIVVVSVSRRLCTASLFAVGLQRRSARQGR